MKFMVIIIFSIEFDICHLRLRVCWLVMIQAYGRLKNWREIDSMSSNQMIKEKTKDLKEIVDYKVIDFLICKKL